MRVIAGKARSLPLKTVEGLDTRPTTDRIKETLFNMIQGEVPGSRFLDLFAGSGGIGIEALSRGAKEAVFIENSKNAVKCIRDNLAFTGLEDFAIVMEQDVVAGLKRLAGKGLFDIVYMDAPYGMGYERAVLRQLAESALVDPATTIIIEEALDTDLSAMEELGFHIRRIKNYKTNKHVWVCLND